MQAPPTQLGLYWLGRSIGAGGIAQVYLATHPRYGEVAIKLLKPIFGRNREAEKRFQIIHFPSSY